MLQLILKTNILLFKTAYKRYKWRINQIDNNFQWSVIFSTIEMTSKCSKIQVKPPTASEWFHCTVENIITSFLWSVRVQTKENCCRFVFTITVTAFKVHFHWRFSENRACDKDKKIEQPSRHFHGLHSYTRRFATSILAQHSFSMLEKCCNHSKQCHNYVATLCWAKNCGCESFR